MPAAINPRKVRPAELLRLLNTTGHGTVLTEAQFRRHRNLAGYRLVSASLETRREKRTRATRKHLRTGKQAKEAAEQLTRVLEGSAT